MSLSSSCASIRSTGRKITIRIDLRGFLCGVVALCSVAGPAQGGDGARTGGYTSVQSMEALFAGFARAPDGSTPVGDISIEVRVPANYEPARPPGVLVFISPTPRAHPPQRLHDALSARDLIWVSVNDADDRADDRARMVAAYGAYRFIRMHYAIDPRRAYLAGLDGGGDVASLFAQRFPYIFTGYAFFGGARPPEEPPAGDIDLARKARFAFVAGENDRDHDDIKEVFGAYQDAEFSRSQFFSIDGLGKRLPDAADFSGVIEFLDGR